MKTKLYRFFYHYNKVDKLMTVHFRGQCLLAKHFICIPSCETKWNKTQPNIVMRGWSPGLKVEWAKNRITILAEETA